VLLICRTLYLFYMFLFLKVRLKLIYLGFFGSNIGPLYLKSLNDPPTLFYENYTYTNSSHHLFYSSILKINIIFKYLCSISIIFLNFTLIKIYLFNII